MSDSHRRFKDALFEQLARVGKALGSPKRLELIDLLAQAPRTVEALAGECGLSVANASQHLQMLLSAQLVERTKNGSFAEYRLANPEVAALYLRLRAVAEDRLAEIPRLLQQEFDGDEDVEPVDREELIRRVREGRVMLIDVRPAEEYQAGHLPGAISIPLPELSRRIKELKKSSEIVAYCRGPYCVFARDAVAMLRRKGYRAHRLDLGVPDWRARGLPMERRKERTR